MHLCDSVIWICQIKNSSFFISCLIETNTAVIGHPIKITDFLFYYFQIINDLDNSNLNLVLFQYRTCPFCCKVRAYLDSRGISYEIVEVDAVLRQAIKWSGYKKVPIVLAKVEGGYQVTIYFIIVFANYIHTVNNGVSKWTAVQSRLYCVMHTCYSCLVIVN